jgi:hypothetical protein
VGGRGGWVRGWALAGPKGRDSSSAAVAVAVVLDVHIGIQRLGDAGSMTNAQACCARAIVTPIPINCIHVVAQKAPRRGVNPQSSATAGDEVPVGGVAVGYQNSQRRSISNVLSACRLM